LILALSFSNTDNVRLARITKSIEYDMEEDEYLVTSFKTGQKYEVFKLNKIWVCTCKSFVYNKERFLRGCKHTQRVKLVDFARKIGYYKNKTSTEVDGNTV